MQKLIWKHTSDKDIGPWIHSKRVSRDSLYLNDAAEKYFDKAFVGKVISKDDLVSG